MDKKSEDTVATEETGWTKADLQKLLATMKDSIPNNQKMKNYISGLKSFNWNKVAFPPFSPEECKQKWTKMQENMRKIRTLTELIVEAEDVIANPGCNRKGEDEEGPPPKPPHTGYMLFCKEQLMSMTGTSRKNKLDVCGQRWQDLSDAKKEKYRTKSIELNRQYRIKLNAYLERFDVVEQQRILRENGIKIPKKHKLEQDEECTEDEEGPPPKPPHTGYNMFCKEQLACMPGTSKRNEFYVCGQRWQELSKTEKEKYRTNCTELNRQYRIKLNAYLERFDIEEQQRILRENGIKTPKKHKDELMEQRPGEPKRPSLSGNVIFCQNQMKLLKKKIPNSTQRFVEANRKWQDLSTMQKEHYQRKVDEKMEKYSMELQEWFKTLTAAEQKNYLTRNPKKHQYLKAKKKDFVKKPRLCQPSDSEDDDIEFSEEESCRYYEEDKDEDEEEEDEEDAMFEM